MSVKSVEDLYTEKKYLSCADKKTKETGRPSQHIMGGLRKPAHCSSMYEPVCCKE